MIDLSNYPLTYTRRADGKIFRAKRVTPNDFVLVDPEDGTKKYISYYARRKFFVPHADNSRKTTEMRICKRKIS